MARLHFHARQQLYNLTSGMFFRPTLIITTLSIVAIAATISLGHGRGFAWLFPGEPSAAQLVLSTIASSMMTVVSVVYSILLVALSLASMQFSTRVLRHFIRDKVSQQTLGVFVGTFVYCLLLLRVVQSQPTPVVPELGVGIAIVLALVAMAQLVYFIHHISQFIQANHLVDSIANEAETVIDAVFPSKGSIVAPLPAQWSDRPRSPVISSGSGYVQLLDEPGLAQIARALDGVIVVHVSVGHFATKGLPIAFVHSNKSVDERTRDAIVDCFDLGPIRTMQDDAEWGVRQIVDIALKAISPAVNDPSTAATCIDQLGRLLVHAALRADPPDRYAAEGESVARVLRDVGSLRSLVDLAFTQIRQYARSDMAVALRLLRAIEGVAPFAESHHAKQRLLAHATMIRDELERHFHSEDCAELRGRFQCIEGALSQTEPTAREGTAEK
ncbi:MAG: DUF2254 domain-containing protein [Polyangiales bacterium]